MDKLGDYALDMSNSTGFQRRDRARFLVKTQVVTDGLPKCTSSWLFLTTLMKLASI